MANSAVLSDRAIIAVEGPEARDFLQGLITNDIASCRVGQAIYAALLTPQGKILFDFLITQDQQQYLVDCAGASAADLMKRLGFYRLRAKVPDVPIHRRQAAVPQLLLNYMGELKQCQEPFRKGS